MNMYSLHMKAPCQSPFVIVFSVNTKYNAPKGTVYRNTWNKLETTKQIRSFTDLLQSNQSINISTQYSSDSYQNAIPFNRWFFLVPLGLLVSSS